MLALLLPVIEEHVLEERGQLVVRLDAVSVVQLGEQFDVQREGEHRPGALAEDHARDVVGVHVETVAGGQGLTDQVVDTAE